MNKKQKEKKIVKIKMKNLWNYKNINNKNRYNEKNQNILYIKQWKIKMKKWIFWKLGFIVNIINKKRWNQSFKINKISN